MKITIDAIKKLDELGAPTIMSLPSPRKNAPILPVSSKCARSTTSTSRKLTSLNASLLCSRQNAPWLNR